MANKLIAEIGYVSRFTHREALTAFADVDDPTEPFHMRGSEIQLLDTLLDQQLVSFLFGKDSNQILCGME